MRRRLFLDDDPTRAAVFIARYADAVWVQTAPECVSQLGERWDEVHLDHDLGGEHFVDSGRDDCGMAVVRWLTEQPRRHLARTHFTVHSHNMVAAYEMLLRLQAAGFHARARPFGMILPEAPPAWLDFWRRFRFGTAAKLRRVAARFGRGRRQGSTPPDAAATPPGPPDDPVGTTRNPAPGGRFVDPPLRRRGTPD